MGLTNQVKRRIFVFVAVILSAVLLVLVNIVAVQYNLRFDLTKAQQHTLSQQTAVYIKGLKQDIHVTALHVGIPPKYLEDMFKEYERLSNGRIKTKIIDPLVELGYAAQFGNIITGKQKKVVVQSGTQRQDVDFTDDVLTEELLTNAVIRVTREGRKAYFLTGHNEFKLDDEDDHGLSILRELLSTNNMESQDLLLTATGGVPSDCDVLVVAGAKSHLSADEVKIIDDYLKKGGDALFLIEHTLVTTPDKPLTQEELSLNPSLNEILNGWGVKVNNDIVVDLKSHAAGDVGSPATNNYLSHRAIVSGLDYTFYVRPRSISIQPGRRESLKVAPVVLTQSAKDSWGESDRFLKVQFDELLDKPAPVPISFVIWEPKAPTLGSDKNMDPSVGVPTPTTEQSEGVGKGKLSDTRLIVFTDADFLTNVYIGALSNAQMGLNAMNWLSELDYKTFLDKKTFQVEKLELTSRQKKTVVLILILMPVVIALAGAVVWARRH
ncbi:MAG TPA: GldG family protein [Candidatus Omnitrophota bacterium]|nr:GldG family protein [Candidatus Omnitrophota bacterium]